MSDLADARLQLASDSEREINNKNLGSYKNLRSIQLDHTYGVLLNLHNFNNDAGDFQADTGFGYVLQYF